MLISSYPQSDAGCNRPDLAPTIVTRAEWESVRRVADALDREANAAPSPFIAVTWRELAASVRWEFDTAD